MHAESIVNWFAPPARPPASYLPPPYGSRRGVVDAFARLPARAAHLPGAPVAWTAVESTGAKHSAARAADFGHDNLAWSRPRVRYSLGRIAWTAAGGAVFGAALALWLGAIVAGSGARAPAVARVPERAPVAASDGRPGASPTRVPRASAQVEHGGAHGLTAAVGPGRSVEQAAPTVPALPAVRQDTSDVGAVERSFARTAQARPAPRAARDPQPVLAPVAPAAPARPEACGDDWPCGETLHSMRIELANWEAEQARRAQVSPPNAGPNASVRLSEHVRLTD